MEALGSPLCRYRRCRHPSGARAFRFAHRGQIAPSGAMRPGCSARAGARIQKFRNRRMSAILPDFAHRECAYSATERARGTRDRCRRSRSPTMSRAPSTAISPSASSSATKSRAAQRSPPMRTMRGHRRVGRRQFRQRPRRLRSPRRGASSSPSATSAHRFATTSTKPASVSSRRAALASRSSRIAIALRTVPIHCGRAPARAPSSPARRLCIEAGGRRSTRFLLSLTGLQTVVCGSWRRRAARASFGENLRLTGSSVGD